MTGSAYHVFVDLDGTCTLVTPDGTRIVHSPDGATATSYPDGAADVSRAGTSTHTDPDGTVTTIYPDGTAGVRTLDGHTTLHLPDGTVVRPDGSLGADPRWRPPAPDSVIPTSYGPDGSITFHLPGDASVTTRATPRDSTVLPGG